MATIEASAVPDPVPDFIRKELETPADDVPPLPLPDPETEAKMKAAAAAAAFVAPYAAKALDEIEKALSRIAGISVAATATSTELSVDATMIVAAETARRNAWVAGISASVPVLLSRAGPNPAGWAPAVTAGIRAADSILAAYDERFSAPAKTEAKAL